MSKLKVLLYSNRESEIDDYARLLSSDDLQIELLTCRSQGEVDEKISEAEIIFGVHLPAESYLKARSLRWIQSMWAGVEGLMQAPIPESVLITRPFGVFGRFIRHYVFGNLLALNVQFEKARKNQFEQAWEPYRIDLLEGKTLAIAGFGDIAQDTAACAKAFGMNVWGMNRDGRAKPFADRMFSFEDRIELVKGADVLLLTLPLSENTRGMFDAELLQHLKRSAVFINVGRGGLVDDEALAQMLTEKKLAAAILDVFNQEPLPSGAPYWKLPNCIVTPHIAGPSLPADITSCFLENLANYRNGNALKALVNRSQGY